MEKSDFSKAYSVKITFVSSGTGVIVKADKGYCYLLSAKHIFKNSQKKYRSYFCSNF